MIPKIIHYCWFGRNELNSSIKQYMESWYRYCPDYQIIQWNENNYNINNCCKFVQDAYKVEKWAFVSDYVRLDIIYKNGGIYLDTDVELITSLNELLIKYKNGYMGWQDDSTVNSGLGFAFPKNSIILQEMMEFYHFLRFDIRNLDNLVCTKINTQIFVNHGLQLNGKLQIIDNVAVLPQEYLCPFNINTGKMNFTKRTVSIHHFNAQWMTKFERKKMKLILTIKKHMPLFLIEYLRKYIRILLKNVFSSMKILI